MLLIAQVLRQVCGEALGFPLDGQTLCCSKRSLNFRDAPQALSRQDRGKEEEVVGALEVGSVVE